MARKERPRKALTPVKRRKNSKRGTQPATTGKLLQRPAANLIEEPEDTEDASGIFPIVGIGASAGGLEALTELLQYLPADTGMAFVFVQHLDPQHVSMLTQLLQRGTHMTVQEATNGVKVEPNHLYVIPRNTHMTLVRGILTLSPRLSSPAPHMPIDPFLRSLAADRKSKAIGIILSGNASDGTLGMMSIKASGGITFSQTVESAKYDSMPRSAIASGCVDLVLSPKEIAEELARLGQHPYVVTRRQPPGHMESLPGTAEAIVRILTLLRTARNVDFTYYKPTTIRRRILRRMALRGLDNLDRYATILRSDTAELNALFEDILINVTEFFRDPEVFEALKKDIFPKIAPSKEAPDSIRVWVPGCSSGEEAYSLAMALLEYLGERANEVTIQIFGTDISDTALEKARKGIYPPGVVEEISPDRIGRFFTKVDSSYLINKRIREMCVFAKQNLIKDPPFSKIDLLSCRNVLIYFGPLLQKRLTQVFHYALKPTGFLLLGTSESMGSSELFAIEDKKCKIYSRLPAIEHFPLEFPSEQKEAATTADRGGNEGWTEAELGREADRIVLGKYGTVGVVADSNFKIVQFRGRTSPYLEPPSGKADFGVLAMAREGLASELQSLLEKARIEKTAVRRESVRLRRGSDLATVDIEVVPFRKWTGRENYYLILFNEAPKQSSEPYRRTPAKRLSLPALQRENKRVLQELTAAKEHLQSIVEQHQATEEELRSFNEEVQSGNEELQSTNEELETAKEEMQSTNEELNTVNEELQTRNAQLAHLGNDLANLLNNVNIPIIMLGSDLRIRRFTTVSQRRLNLIPSDVGRPIGNINLNLQIPDLDQMLLEVMETLMPKNLNVKDSSGRRYSVRIRPYRTEDNKIEGAVIVVVDLDPVRALVETFGELSLETNASSIGADKDLDGTEQVQADELRAFGAGLLIAQERERRSLALELHDDVTQRLALLEFNLTSLEHSPPSPEKLKDELKLVHEQLGALSDTMRNIAHQLHPSTLDDLGLTAALTAYIRDLNGQQGVAVTFQHDNVPGRLDQDTTLCLYRVVQEALHNVVKHSGAKTAQVTLSGTDHNALTLRVKDFGVGFRPSDDKKGGLGLRSMQERVRLLGGELRIESEPGRGTEILVTVPQKSADGNRA